jgi:nicotinamidase-related amidase
MLQAKDCCLVVVDIQGKLADLAVDKETLLANTAVLIQAAKALEIPILWCQQVPKALGETVESLKTLLQGNEPIDKYSFSCCGDENFADKLTAIEPKQAILCGIESHVCVYQTAIHLLEKGIEVHIIADAVSSRTKANKKIALKRMLAEGAKLSSTEMCLFEMLKDAKHPKFKEIAKLIK